MLRGFSDGIQPMFQGFCYRRDWIAKYGANPQTGAAFTYGFTDENDFESWEDDVVFPNGTDEPLYISDWEWMFEIFEKAMEEQGISDGYCYSPYYYGYMQTGDLFTGFGGGAPYWYNDNGTCVNGIETDSFRAYLQCLNTWYQKGWLDKSFSEHTSDVFFAVDAPKVFQEKLVSGREEFPQWAHRLMQTMLTRTAQWSTAAVSPSMIFMEVLSSRTRSLIICTSSARMEMAWC